MLFSLKLQRDNRKNALSVAPAKGKPEKKAVFSPHCGDETTTNYYNKAFLNTKRRRWSRKRVSPCGGSFSLCMASDCACCGFPPVWGEVFVKVKGVHLKVW